MNRRIDIVYLGIGVLCMAGLIAASACNSTKGQTPSPPERPIVQVCRELNADKDQCNKAMQRDSKDCTFDENLNICRVKPAPADCAKLNADETACKGSKDCTYDDTAKVCNDAAQKGKCENILIKAACDLDVTCLWNAIAAPAVCQTRGPDEPIYVWKQITLPAVSTPDEIKHFVVNKDNTHGYLYTDHVGGEGLYFSANQGATWTRIGTAPGNAIVSGKVKPAAVNFGTVNAAAIIPISLKPTKKGAVVSTTEGVWLIEGIAVKWGITKNVNHSAVVAAQDRVANFENQNIQFVDVVELNGREFIVFAQAKNALTDGYVWLKSTANADEPKRFEPQKATAVGPITGTVMGSGKAAWMRAGNTHDNDLLLASANTGANEAKGLWHFPKDNVPNDDLMTLYTCAAGNVWKATLNDAVMFPEAAGGAGVEWFEDALPGNNGNMVMTVIGSFNAGAPAPLNHTYFAGLKNNSANGGPQLSEAGGLVRHQGVQAGGQHAIIGLMTAFTVYSMAQVGGNLLPVTSRGIKGIKPDGTADPSLDYPPMASFGLDTHHMMEGTRDAVLFLAMDNWPIALYGDDALTWYRINGAPADLKAGIYVRKRGIGQPRL